MNLIRPFKFISHFIRERSVPFIRENAKIIAQSILTVFFIGIGIWFITNEKAELIEVKTVLSSARWDWVFVGIGLTIAYILLQGLMYVASFSTVNSKVSLTDSVILFLKRNFISVFLPAGGISSLAFFTGPIVKKGIKETQIHFASSIYGFVGILSVVIVAIPAFMFAIFQGSIGNGEWVSLFTIILLLAVLIATYRSMMNEGFIYKKLIHYFPSSEIFIDDLRSNKINKKEFFITIFYSILIEFVGIAHLYIVMLALNLPPSLFAAVMGYIVSVIFLIISPFLRGLGAIEVSMSYVLMRFGFADIEAISLTFLFRFFEFWMPLLIGAGTFLLKINKFLMRIFPALFLLVLGIINIVSVLTPAIALRIVALKDFIPTEAIHASNYLVLVAGLFLLVTAAFMLKGLRSAWWFALGLSVISLIGHITKAIDYEEALVALFVIVILFATRKEYFIKNNPQLRFVGLQTSVLSIAAVLIYGTIGFYFLDKKHFNIDFSLLQSFRYSLQEYFLVGSADLIPTDIFAKNFLYSINISGFLSIGFLIYTLVIPNKSDDEVSDEELVIAKELLSKYGNSAVDYFKTYSDKTIFITDDKKAFISYRVSGNYAVVLENPVAENEESLRNCIAAFDKYCYGNGLKCIYYRIPEENLEIYKSFRKKQLLLGQEGIVDLATFTLEGGSKKSLRNGLKKVSEKGFKTTTYLPPIKDGLLQKIKAVSDEWLIDTDRSEIIFSQGMFVEEELKYQTIITVENQEERIVAFLNVIPDYTKGEGTYDLIRKTKDAPNGTMDFILIELFNYLKSQNYATVNLGFAPMSGLDDPTTFPERSMKFAYNKIKSFSHYRGLRDFKEKYDPVWKNKYLIYSHDYDLLQIPVVLTNVIKP